MDIGPTSLKSEFSIALQAKEGAKQYRSLITYPSEAEENQGNTTGTCGDELVMKMVKRAAHFCFMIMSKLNAGNSKDL